jgi:hypothetical protein
VMQGFLERVAWSSHRQATKNTSKQYAVKIETLMIQIMVLFLPPNTWNFDFNYEPLIIYS